eukprot:PITA_13848
MEHTKNCVPLFNENNYELWKGRMEVYLLAQDYEVWDTVENGFTPTPNEQGKKNLVNDAKAKNIIISGLIESAYHKVLGCKTTKNVWDKLENIYAGDSNVKEAKLQMYREKFKQLRMKEDDNIVAYFQHVVEITNTLEGLGEPVDERTIIRKILRMLPARFNPKVSVLEYSANMEKLSKEELNGVLITYEMRLDEEEAKCLNISDGNSKGKKGFKKFNKQGNKKGFKRNFLSKEDNSSFDEDSDSEEEANERLLFMAKHNKQEVSNNKDEGLTIEEFSKEAIKLIKELKAEKIHSNTVEEQVQGIKIEVEEHKCIEESLQNKLEESNREREALEVEVVSLHKEVKKGKIVQNYAKISRALEELINNQRSYND